MIYENGFNPQMHIDEIGKSINELLKLSKETDSPATDSKIQYISTIIDNTIALLTSPYNSLVDNEHQISIRNISHSNLWVSIMQAVHRSFFASIHMALEKGLKEFCEENEIIPSSSIARDSLKSIEIIEIELAGNNVELQKVTKYLNRLKKPYERMLSKPQFDDYLQPIIKNSKMSEEQKDVWKDFFAALTIIRNKSSHSDPTINDREVGVLEKAGLGAMVVEGQIALSPLQYSEICNHLIHFIGTINHFRKEEAEGTNTTK